MVDLHFNANIHLLDLVQITVDVVTRGRSVQILFVLLQFFFYKVSYVLVDVLYCLVWPRQTPHQMRKRVVKLWSEAGQTDEVFI